MAYDVQWAQVEPGQVLVATAGRAWLHRVLPIDPFSETMRSPGRSDTTRSLLDAAIGAFQRERLRATAPPLTLQAYVESLGDNYHAGHDTPRLLRRASERFAAAGRHDLSRWASHAADAEDHEHLTLADLAALGYPPPAVAALPCSPRVEAAVAFFAACVESEDPVSCLGYVYALERPAALVSASYVAAVEALLGPTIDATRCLRAHSCVGVEPDHVESLLAIIASLPGDDRARVVQATYQTSRIIFSEADQAVATAM